MDATRRDLILQRWNVIQHNLVPALRPGPFDSSTSAKAATDTPYQPLPFTGDRSTPLGLAGRIEWIHLDNRPYLRAMHIALLSYRRLRRHKHAVTLIELLLGRNPNDNQGVRYLLGSEALRAGDDEHARSIFGAETDGYPPYFYELALSYMLKNEWTAAATALRRGFAANPYIAELLCGNLNPARLAIWHGSNMAEPGTAHAYIQMYGMFWHTQPNSFAFTRWLFNHPKVMMERATTMECQEALLWEVDGGKREEASQQQTRLIRKIDDTMSAAIVTKRMDRRGKTLIWPWTQPRAPRFAPLE